MFSETQYKLLSKLGFYWSSASLYISTLPSMYQFSSKPFLNPFLTVLISCLKSETNERHFDELLVNFRVPYQSWQLVYLIEWYLKITKKYGRPLYKSPFIRATKCLYRTYKKYHGLYFMHYCIKPCFNILDFYCTLDS